MKLNKSDISTVCAALNAAAQWEDDLADAYSNMKTAPEYAKARGNAAKYRKLRSRIVGATTSEKK